MLFVACCLLLVAKDYEVRFLFVKCLCSNSRKFLFMCKTNYIASQQKKQNICAKRKKFKNFPQNIQKNTKQNRY